MIDTERKDHISAFMDPLPELNYVEKIKNKEYRIITVDDTITIDMLMMDIQSSKVIYMDTETTNLSPSRRCKLIQLSFDDDPKIYITKPHQRILDSLLESDALFIGANLSFDILTLIEAYQKYDKTKYRNHKTGLMNSAGRKIYESFYGRTYDVTAAAQVLTGKSFPDNLENIAKGVGVEDSFKYRASLDSERISLDMSSMEIFWMAVPVSNVLYNRYAGWDICLVRYVYEQIKQYDMKPSQERMIDQEFHTRLIYAMFGHDGLSVNWKKAANVHLDFKKGFSENMQELAEIAGLTEKDFPYNSQFNKKVFKIGSTAQVDKMLKEHGVEITATTEKTGAVSITKDSLGDAKVVELEMENDEAVELIDKLLETKSYQKDISMIKNWVKNSGDPWDLNKNRLYPSLTSIGTATSRSACSEPNMQQVNKHEGSTIMRNIIIPHKQDNNLTYVIFSVDYNGQELRAYANLTGDTKLADDLAAEVDMHGNTALEVFGPDYTKAQRNKAKSAIFATLFGASLGKVARTIGTSLPDAQKIIKVWSETYPKAWKESHRWQHTLVDDKGRLHTPWGWVADLGRDKKGRLAKYKALNYMVQGFAAFITKQGIENLNTYTVLDGHMTDIPLWRWLLMVIHDEGLFNCPSKHAENIMQQVEKAMTIPWEYVDFTTEGNIHGEFWRADL